MTCGAAHEGCLARAVRHRLSSYAPRPVRHKHRDFLLRIPCAVPPDRSISFFCPSHLCRRFANRNSMPLPSVDLPERGESYPRTKGGDGRRRPIDVGAAERGNALFRKLLYASNKSIRPAHAPSRRQLAVKRNWVKDQPTSSLSACRTCEMDRAAGSSPKL